jgi:hypothetical protein
MNKVLIGISFFLMMISVFFISDSYAKDYGPCGDNIINVGEMCDAGTSCSDVAPDACRCSCRSAFCDDGVIDTGEECDSGNTYNSNKPNMCRDNCTLPYCGDGIVDDGELSFRPHSVFNEECDDGNSNNFDSCTNDCKKRIDPRENISKINGSARDLIDAGRTAHVKAAKVSGPKYTAPLQSMAVSQGRNKTIKTTQVDKIIETAKEQTVDRSQLDKTLVEKTINKKIAGPKSYKAINRLEKPETVK